MTIGARRLLPAIVHLLAALASVWRPNADRENTKGRNMRPSARPPEVLAFIVGDALDGLADLRDLLIAARRRAAAGCTSMHRDLDMWPQAWRLGLMIV
jgi:hypothetical protein